MKPLQPPDSHHLKAAQGWLELGNQIEANEELEQITPELRHHPAVLELRWAIYYAAKKWDVCSDIARSLVELAPDRADYWRNRAASVHFMGRSKEAYDLLFPALEKFPDDWSIHYDMACYACVLGNLKEAWTRLEKALDLSDLIQFSKWEPKKISNAKSVKLLALEDPDLEQLWTEIGQI
jgi:tetratricopeptide (TPR) repeat protein